MKRYIRYAFFVMLFFHGNPLHAQSLSVADTSNLGANAVNRSLLLKLVNDARKKGCYCGKEWMEPTTPLVWSRRLELAAFRHSNEMESFNYFSHTSEVNGTSSQDRVVATGYEGYSFGENIYLGAADEKNAIAGWLQSPGHCKNIMRPVFREMGVARKGEYWTQVFGAR